MANIDRRAFLGQTAGLVTAALTGRALGAEVLTSQPASQPISTSQPTSQPAEKFLRASDTITLGKTGIKASRMALGTGYNSGKEVRDLGIKGSTKLLRHAYDQGITWWESADMYKTHPHIKAALQDIKQRDRVVLTTKTSSTTAADVKADVERFRQELGVDVIDILLMHCMQGEDWPTKMKGAMDALSEAKQKGHVRAVGFSCHGFDALKAGRDEPWSDIILARFNPHAAIMDVEKAEQVPKVEEILKAMHDRGKTIYAMKVIGAGTFRYDGNKIDESFKFVLSKRFISGFTVGMYTFRHIDENIERIDQLKMMA